MSSSKQTQQTGHQVQIMDITPAMAKDWLDNHNPNNRKYRPKKAKQYARMMERGQWISAGDVYQFDANGDVLDGQHRLGASVEADYTIKGAVVIGSLPTERFKVIDSGMTRSAGDVLGNGVTSATNKAATVRLLYVYEAGGDPRATEDRTAVTRLDVAEYYSQHAEEVDYAVGVGRRLYDAFAGGNYTAWAAFTVLAQRTPGGHADDFLEGVLTGANLGADDVRLALRNWLANDRQLPTAGAHLGILIKAWNNWMTGKTRFTIMFRENEDFPQLIQRRTFAKQTA